MYLILGYVTNVFRLKYLWFPFVSLSIMSFLNLEIPCSAFEITDVQYYLITDNENACFLTLHKVIGFSSLEIDSHYG